MQKQPSAREVQGLLRDSFESYLKGAPDDKNRNEYQTRLRGIKKKYPKQFRAIQELNTANNERIQNSFDFNMDDLSQDPISKAGLKGAKYKASSPYGYDRRNFPIGPNGQEVHAFESPATGIRASGLLDGEDLDYVLRHESQHTLPDRRLSSENAVRQMDGLYTKLNNPDSRIMQGDAAVFNPNSSTERGLLEGASNLLPEGTRDARSQALLSKNEGYYEPNTYDGLARGSGQRRLDYLNNADVFKKNKHYIEPR